MEPNRSTIQSAVRSLSEEVDSALEIAQKIDV